MPKQVVSHLTRRLLLWRSYAAYCSYDVHAVEETASWGTSCTHCASVLISKLISTSRTCQIKKEDGEVWISAMEIICILFQTLPFTHLQSCNLATRSQPLRLQEAGFPFLNCRKRQFYSTPSTPAMEIISSSSRSTTSTHLRACKLATSSHLLRLQESV